MNQFFASGGQSIGVSASTSVLPMNTQDLFPLGWTGWISLQFKGLSKVFSNTTVQKHQFSALISMAKKLSTKQLKLIFLSELVCFYPTPLCSLFPRHSGPSLKPLSTFFPFHSHFVAQLKHFAWDWSPLGWTGWFSLQSKGLSRVFSNTTIQKHKFFGTHLSSQSNPHIHT